MRKWKIISAVLLVALLTVVITGAWTPRNSGLQGVWNIIQKKEFVDLTHAFEPGIPHWPGFPDEKRETVYWCDEGVLKYLYEDRRITASGHETLDTDPGIAASKGNYSLETYILGTDHYQIELLANPAKA